MLDIAAHRAAVIAKIGFEESTEPESTEISLLAKILECDSESIELALGRLGEKLKVFLHAVDIKHPHVRDLFNDIFADGEFCQDITELIQLAQLAKEKKLTRVFSSLGDKISKDKLCRTFLKAIDNPRYRIRLLHTREERDQVRADKKIQAIDLTAVVKKGEDVWASQPDNFDSFIRWGIAYEEEINFATKKAQRYIKLGCSGMAKQIIDSIEQFKSQVHEFYYGFNRITMTNAAVILAKSLGCKLSTYWLSGESEKKLYRVIVPRNIFEGYNFEAVASYDAPYRSKDSYDYEPRVYPLHKLKSSSYIKRIVDHLEAFPKACGKSIFDNYAVIVPGICYPRNDKPPFCILTKEGGYISYETREEAVQALDVSLIDNNYITPILLGEKDGKCFFISFFV